jgi:hypothetical protein
MKKFKEFEPKDDDAESPTRDSVINIVANSLNRSGDKDSKSVLMLIAAIGLLNLSKESSLALNVARKLASQGSRKVK